MPLLRVSAAMRLGRGAARLGRLGVCVVPALLGLSASERPNRDDENDDRAQERSQTVMASHFFVSRIN
jgi:hypothetical protein